MLITFGQVRLCNDTREEAMSGLQIGGQPIIEVVAFPRAEGVVTFERGNRVTALSFTVSRRFRTVSERELFPAQHLVDLPDKAVLKLLSTSGTSGGGAIYLQQAALAALPRFREAHGIGWHIDYSFVGAKLDFSAS